MVDRVREVLGSLPVSSQCVSLWKSLELRYDNEVRMTRENTNSNTRGLSLEVELQLDRSRALGLAS